MNRLSACILSISFAVGTVGQSGTSGNSPLGHDHTPGQNVQTVGLSQLQRGSCYRVLSAELFEQVVCPSEEKPQQPRASDPTAATNLDASRQSEIATAVKAVKKIKNDCADPTSFALLEVTTYEVNAGGCVHYVAKNGLGAGKQLCGSYHTDKKGRLEVFGGDIYHAGDPCSCEGRGTDITDEVKGQIK